MKKQNVRTYLILHNIRSVYNVGAIFRTADACGITTIFLTGYTPTPLDRFRRERKDFLKTSLGAQRTIVWAHHREPSALIRKLKKEKVTIVGVEQGKDAIDYKNVVLTGDTAFVFGNEVKGISNRLQKQCDILAYIPMRGAKESLNVSVSAGIFLFRVLGI